MYAESQASFVRSCEGGERVGKIETVYCWPENGFDSLWISLLLKIGLGGGACVYGFEKKKFLLCSVEIICIVG